MNIVVIQGKPNIENRDQYVKLGSALIEYLIQKNHG